MALIDVLTRPPRLPRAVDRPRLRESLSEGDEPGRLVVAPAGSGKTVAAAQLLAATNPPPDPTRPVRTGWCRLAPGASGADDLVRLVAAALGVSIEAPGLGTLERAAVLLDVLGEDPTTVVIDDYDLGRPEECDAVLAEVLALAPPTSRIVVCGAARPAGLVGRASVGHLRLIGASELAFTDSEVAALLTLLGQDPAGAPQLRSASAGWATAVAVLAETALSGSGGLPEAVELLLDRAGITSGLAPGESPGRVDALAVLSMLPAVGAAELEAAGVDPDLLARLAAETALLRPVGDRWALLDVARLSLRRRLSDDRRHAIAREIAPAVADTDPLGAAALLLDVDDDAAAADLLAGHASAVSPDAAVPLLYRMRPDVRRRLPPSLSAARATVEMDSALAEAEARLAAARNDRERVEAQVAVAAILVHRGQLSSACALLEAALRAPRFTAVQAASAAVGWLGLARFWAGDLDGAAATVASGADGQRRLAASSSGGGGAVGWAGAESTGERRLRSTSSGDGGSRVPDALRRPGGPAAAVGIGTGSPSPLALWVSAEVALAPPSDLDAALEAAHSLQIAGWLCAADAVLARRALHRGAEEEASAAASRAYRAATVHGGFDLLVAGPVHAWCLARSGRWDEAITVADTLRRRMGPVDTCARLHADLVLEAAARARDDAIGIARHARAVAGTRKLGYAPVEAAARHGLGLEEIPRPSPFGATAGSPPVAPRHEGAVAARREVVEWPRHPAAAGLEVALLGSIVVRVDGVVVRDDAWRSRKAREVLVVLALAGEAGLGRDEMVEAVWPDRDPTRGRTLLRTALAEVRRVLEPARPPGEPSRFVLTHGDRISVAARTDVAEAERLWTAARRIARSGGRPTSDFAAEAVRAGPVLPQSRAGRGGTPRADTVGQGTSVTALLAAWRLFRGAPVADEPYAASLDQMRTTAERLRIEVADALLAASLEAFVTGSAAPARTGGGAVDAGGSASLAEVLEAIVAAAEHVLTAEQWRTEVAERAAATCRALGDEASALRVERLLGGSGAAQ